MNEKCFKDEFTVNIFYKIVGGLHPSTPPPPSVKRVHALSFSTLHRHPDNLISLSPYTLIMMIDASYLCTDRQGT